VSHTGIGIRVGPTERLPEGADATLTVTWNEFESTTFTVDVVTVGSDRGHVLLGLGFVAPNAQQKNDLFKHLYTRMDVAGAERKAA
jgi:hypothetical protein